MNPIEAAEEVADHLARLIHPAKESTVTETTQAPAAPDQASFWGMLHHNVDLFTGSMERFLPKLKAIATNPALDDGVDALIAAFAGPMAGEVFDALIALLKAQPEDQESAAFDLLKTVMHSTAAPPAGPADAQEPATPAQPAAPAQATFTPAVRVGAPAQAGTPAVMR